jgi:predicted secreted protein
MFQELSLKYFLMHSPKKSIKEGKMKLKIIMVLPLLIVTMIAVSCVVTSRDVHVQLTCDDFSGNPTSMQNNFQIETGDKIYVELCSNPSTGFGWSYEMSGDAAVKEEDHDFESSESDMPGAAGKETWTFEAIKKGTTVINMSYSQPWEGGTKGEWKYKIEVTVN